jgi:lipopolysaccharide biosynthesis protein
MLANPDLDMPFCLCWANENWTRRWDGLEAEVLIAQQHSPEDDIAFIRDIEPALRDSRYIRIDGRPLLVVYRPSLFPDARATAALALARAVPPGFGDLFLVSTHAFDHIDPTAFGFDAAMDFAPNNMNPKAITAQIPSVNPAFTGTICDYRTCCPERHLSELRAVPRRHADVGHDARRQGRVVDLGAHLAGAYSSEWLTNACRYTEAQFGSRMPFVFINAWNEWAEGAHLEPDRRHGYAYLQATAVPQALPRPRPSPAEGF